MAAIYDLDTGNAITEGLQGCNICNEAILAAEHIADSLDKDVELHDDDGRWIVHPRQWSGDLRNAGIISHREPADFVGE